MRDPTSRMLRERVEVFTATLRRAPSKDVPRWTAVLGARVSRQVFPWRPPSKRYLALRSLLRMREVPGVLQCVTLAVAARRAG